MLLLAVGLLAAAAYVAWPKLRPPEHGPVRLTIENNIQASMLELAIDLRTPPEAVAGPIPGTIAADGAVTVYEGPGPIMVESIAYTSGADGALVTRVIAQRLEPDHDMVLRVTVEGVEALIGELDAQSP